MTALKNIKRKVARWVAKRASVSLAEETREVPPQDFARGIPEGNVTCVVEVGERVALVRSHLNRPLPSRRAELDRPHYDAAPLRLYAINDARFEGSARYFADGRGKVVRESTRHWHPKSAEHGISLSKARRIFGDAQLTKGPRLRGIHALAASAFATNYYHWHFDLLPAVVLLNALMPSEPFGILAGGDKEFIRSSLQFLHIDPERLVFIPTDRSLTVEHLVICSTQQNSGLKVHPRIAEIFRSIKRGTLGENGFRPSRRVFVSRGSDPIRRPLLNRKEVEERFAAEGFQIVDPGALGYGDQVRIFHEAEIVVGEHGAGMANTGFCQPGTLVVELFNPARNDLCYFSLAQLQGLHHRIYVGKSEPARPGSRFEWSVDADDVLAFALASIDASRASVRRTPAQLGP